MPTAAVMGCGYVPSVHLGAIGKTDDGLAAELLELGRPDVVRIYTRTTARFPGGEPP